MSDPNQPDNGNQHSAPDNSKKQVVEGILADLAEETRELTPVLAELRTRDWDRATPALGWSVRDQVTHLAFFDDATVLTLRAPAAFEAQRAELAKHGNRFPDAVAEQYRKLPGDECLSWLLRSRDGLIAEYRRANPSARLPWYGVEMSVPASITGRLMETWAHGQDIADALGVVRPSSARLRRVAELGVRTFGFSFRQRGLTVPDEPVFVRLAGPDDQTWTWGPSDAANRVEGDLLDFCLVVTQRRNVADTTLRVTGPVAVGWIAIAQAFAGGPTDPRPPGWVTQQHVMTDVPPTADARSGGGQEIGAGAGDRP